ncbi:hypothetical protein D2Q93_07915 [Alicyclobacillaceae bacterium I2511]|nr:hypothetical protein D2Q93_07915 [Alicyclobacillaceae bacterium I2511]
MVAEPAQMILYAPMVWALNTVHVTGHLSNGTTTAVMVEAVTANGGVVASDKVNTTSNGSFTANLYLPDNGPANLAFKAYGGGTAASTGVFYFNAIPLVQGTPAVFSEVRVSAQQMGTDFPVWTPTWLPQSITSTPQSQPAYSANLAAKSFTYTADIFATPRAYPINDSALNTPTPIEIAQIGGQSFASAKAAEQQMMYGLQQTFAQTLPSGTLSLGNLSGVTYTTPTPAILWHEGKWTLVVQGPVPQVNRTEAQAIVRILNQVYLPPTNGLVFVQNTTSVNNTQSAVTEVSFIQGSDLYTVGTQTGQIYNALVMAASSHRHISGVHGIS